MKAVVAPVKNITSTQVAFSSLFNRSYGVPGICCLHGPSGQGKTTALTLQYNQVNGIYVSTRAHDTTSSLIGRIVEELGATPKHQISKNVDYIIEQMSMYERPLFIDEGDYLMRDSRMLDTIRDLYDGTETSVIIAGMDQIVRNVSNHKQFYNRISQWIEFKPADLEDVNIMADYLIEDGIRIEEALLDDLRRATNGEMRRITIGLSKIEALAIANELDWITSKDWGDQPFHGVKGMKV